MSRETLARGAGFGLNRCATCVIRKTPGKRPPHANLGKRGLMGGLVWLASYPKSGNTWTRNVLHNLLAGKGEGQPINAMGKLTTWDIGKKWYEEFLPRAFEDCTREEVAAVRPKAMRKIAAGAEGLVFVKTHNALVIDRGTPMIEPSVTAGAVYIVRNPLDVAISYSHHLDTTIDQSIHRMGMVGAQNPVTEKSAYEVMGSWSEHVASWTTKPKRFLHVMRYEDMLGDPEATFGKLAEFLRIKRNRGKLRKAIELSSFERLKAQEEEKGFREKPKHSERFFRKGEADQWKDELTEAQIKAIVDTHREQMERFGYVPEGY